MTTRFDSTVTTTCGYCGVGCRLEAHARDGRDRLDRPALDGPANEGHTCLKGRFAHQFSRHRERLTTPLIRDRAAAAAPASWEEAIERIVAELTRIKSRPRPRRDRRPRLLARDERGLLRDAAADARRDRHEQHRQLLARLPLADLVALRKSFGLSGATGSFDDFDHADATILIGANPTEGHPVVGARIKQAALRG